MLLSLLLLLACQNLCPEELLGNWKAEGDEGLWIRFESDRSFGASGERLSAISRIVHESDHMITLSSWGRHTEHEWSVNDDILSLQTESMDEAIYYIRTDASPECFHLKALEFAKPRDLDAERTQELRLELEERGRVDQSVRSQEHPDFDEMRRVDGDNTARIKELLVDVGPIDPERFGVEAATAAFLIVQHSGDLPLMLGALPYYEKAVHRKEIDGQHFALLYDRVQVNIGRRQKYGSQLGTSADGVYSVMALVSRDNVDEFRREVGMGPLADYLKLFGDDVAFEDDIKYE